MQDHESREFAKLMAVLAETFGKDVSQPLLDIYFRAFTSWPLDAFRTAVDRAVVTCRFFPKPAELIELIEGSPQEQTALAEHAWRQLWQALDRCGTYRSLFCEDRVLAETIRQVWGGWVGAGMIPRADSDEAPMYQVHHKEFLATYTRLLKRHEAYEPYVRGRIESESSPAMLAQYGQGLVCAYLPRQGIPVQVELAALMPDHPLVALVAARARQALPEGVHDDA